ncbi:kinesin-like protein KIF28P isoform X2 [Corticium candelabrum]|nr:kinesin-like protein KIF28P isoform X2 [Corticium candelabrum]
MACEELFRKIEEKKASGDNHEFQVSLSMLEIYNEQVRDLLNPKGNKKGGLKVREHPKKGFYVDQLVNVPVKDYGEIEKRIEEGTRNRTVAATNMNATSSRAHTNVAITFSQKGKNEAGQDMTKTSSINLVDLAGSERADSTGATGDRLKEGSAINQSLSTLGNVIKALADQSSGKKAVMVPYRDSVLTRLLKNALGGNSKTVMIAALSPADINYEETLSTLRFADRAKAIKTTAVVNESPTDKLIRELREENKKLQEMLAKGGVVQGDVSVGATEEEKELIRKQLEEELALQLAENQREMEEMKRTWEDKLKDAHKSYGDQDTAENKLKEMREKTPHFWNLNEDPQLTKMVFHTIEQGDHRIGNNRADPPNTIILNGLSILPEHANVSNRNGSIQLQPAKDARVLVNGERVMSEVPLHHNDRVMFGSSHLYVVHHPKELAAAKKAGVKLKNVTYDMAQEEIAQNSGFDMQTDGKSKEDILLMEDLVALVPMVNEANAMSEELNKKVVFEIALVSPQARGLKEGRTEVKVKMRHLETDHYWLWSRNKFVNRKYLMQEMYQNYVEGEAWDLSEEKDPFHEDPETDMMIGSVHVYLASLTYMIELEEYLVINDYKANEQGHMEVKVVPCTNEGHEATDDDDLFVDDPEDLVDQKMTFAVKIPCIRGLPSKFSTNVYCKYKFYLDKEAVVTQKISGTSNPDFNHIKVFSYEPVTQRLLDYLAYQPLVIEVWGQQSSSSALKARKKMTTTELIGSERGKSATSVNAGFKDDDEKYRMLCDLATAKRRTERLESKMKAIEDLVATARNNKSLTVQVAELQEALKPSTQRFKAAAKVIAMTERAKRASEDGTIKSAACSVM